MATLRASTTGGRSGRLATFGATVTRSVRAAITDSSVQVSRNLAWYGWSCTVTRSRPTCSLSTASSTTRCGAAASGVRNVPKRRGWP